MKQFAVWVIDLMKKKRSKIGFKIFSGIFLVLFLTLLICLIIFNIVLLRFFEGVFVDEFMNLFETFSIQFESEDKANLESLVIAFGQENRANITVANPNNHDEILFQYMYWEDLRGSDAIRSSWIGVSDAETGVGFLLYAEKSRVIVNEIIEPIHSIFPILIFVSLIISFATSIRFSFYLARPVVQISDMSKKLQSLDFNHSYEIKRSDEIGELAYNLNDMAKRLNRTLLQLNDVNKQLQIEIEDKEKQEKQRGDLFTAISHELKTPLTNLKGTLEGMIDSIGIYQNRDHYLKHAYGIAEKMEYLIHQILLVSRLNMAEEMFEHQMTNISDLVFYTCRNYEEIVQNNHISLVYYCEEGLMAKANLIQLQHVITNLINNAMFHSPKGEFIDVQCTLEEGMGVITVENTGVFIPDDDLDNIFKPFYRVEKSRNRHTGGSGLGLYIVKKILELHDFSYQIENTTEGVLFTITFSLFNDVDNQNNLK